MKNNLHYNTRPFIVSE